MGQPKPPPPPPILVYSDNDKDENSSGAENENSSGRLLFFIMTKIPLSKILKLKKLLLFMLFINKLLSNSIFDIKI